MGRFQLKRREFLVSAAVFGGGMALGLYTPRAPAGRDRVGDAGSRELSAWLAITADDEVIIRVPTPEIGNGASTQIAMNVTEELACDWTRVRLEHASVRRDYLEDGVYSVGFQPFFGGHSTDHKRLPYTLQIGASARERLKAAAAARWQVPAAAVEARDGILFEPGGERRLRYGEVAAEAVGIQLAEEPKPKPRSEWRLLGRASPGKKQLPAIVDGTAEFGIDVKVPGMVHAALMQAPVQGGRLVSHDPEAVLDLPGVRAVVVLDPDKTVGAPVKARATFGLRGTELQSGVAVIADHYWQALKALEALPVEWESGPGAQWGSTEAIYAAAVDILDQDSGAPMKEVGDVNAVTGKVLEQTYRTPFCDHVTMEPLNGTALVTDDHLEIWHPCQDTQQAFWVAVDESGVSPEKVEVHQTLVGGGFGRRTLADDVRTVVAVARAYPGVPVKVIWSREESMRQGRYRTLITARYRATLGQDGLPRALESHACIAGLALPFGWMDTPYVGSGAIPNARFTTSNLPLHLLTGAYRGPCYNSHVFMLESFIDECAVAAGVDPLDYRLRLLADWNPAWSECLRVSAAGAGWGQALPKGQGLGIAIANWPKASLREGGTTIATVARVRVSQRGEVRVEQVDIAFDCGSVANPDAVRAQMEGGVIHGINMTLNEEITIRDGAVVEGNYDRYPMIRMKDAPEVRVHFDALSGHERMEMIGEAPIGPIGPAIGNAIYQATGKRLRTTPFRKHDLSWA